jgi:Mob1/phocein family
MVNQLLNTNVKCNILFSGACSYRTFRRHVTRGDGTDEISDGHFDTTSFSVATLGSQNLRLAVMLPEGEDLNEWVAVHSESESDSFTDHSWVPSELHYGYLPDVNLVSCYLVFYKNASHLFIRYQVSRCCVVRITKLAESSLLLVFGNK